MTDLRGIARRLRMPADQLRLAADLLQQGYQPGFIERYRADETGRLPRATLWALKLEIDSQQRLQNSKAKVSDQLPKDAELDQEAVEALEKATTEVEIDAILRSYRARRNLSQSQERTGQAGELLEKLIAYEGAPIEDLPAWVSAQLQTEGEQSTQVLEQTEKLVAALIQCNTALNEKLRRSIQRKAQIQVAFVDQDKKAANDAAEAAKAESAEQADANTEAASNEAVEAQSAEAVLPAADAATGETSQDATSESSSPEQTAASASDGVATEPQDNAEEATSSDVESTTEASPEVKVEVATAEQGNASESVQNATDEAEVTSDEPGSTEKAAGSEQSSNGETADEAAEKAGQATDAANNEFAEFAGKKSKSKPKEDTKKSAAKMTPRQRRRRWLISMLQPMKSIKKGVTKLTAYQQLMLGRGRRSQLVDTPLSYDKKPIYQMARDAFVAETHPLAGWFQKTVEGALDNSILAKIENDALSDLEELAQEKLLENAADQLRANLNQRPVRGHVIMVVDTVGPKAASVAVVGPTGKVLATDEVSCSAQPATIDQNVVKLGELAHKHRVTLIALTNGPARRYLILTVRELMKQSAASGLRWTMADRGGAEAYAAGRIALRELSAHNRRDRAAIWIGRSLQDPLTQLLKVEQGRLRLGSYQRELPQEPLKQLVRETISDCVCSRGLDVQHANIDALNYVHGVENDQAQQIATLVSQGKLNCRQQLIEEIDNWPEKARRQALGIIRVFESEEVLDGTAIHPEDYILAKRLIENTELNAPPAAPEGWVKPELTPEEPVQDANQNAEAVQAEAAVSPENVASSEASEDKVDVAASAEADAETDAQVSDSEEASSESAETVESPEASSDDSTESSEAAVASGDSQEGSSDETPAEKAETTSAEKDVESQPESEQADSSGTQDEENVPAVKPEYPEDVKPVEIKAPPIDVEKLARGWQVGREKVRWLASCLNDPFGDQRLNGSPIPMLTTMPTLSSLEPGMCVWAVVVGVADFGAFVEIAPDCSGLIHISRLSSEYVEDPHQVVQVGDLLMTWVVSVDEKKNRVALTALSPEQVAANAAARREERSSRGGENRGRSGGREGGRRESGEGFRGKGGKGGQGNRSGDNRGGGRKGGGPGRGGKPRDGGGRGRGPGRKGPSKPIVVKSKKPVAPISSAMKEGDEPLRSFSDLMQFYEAKRTDVPAPKSSDSGEAAVTDKVAAEVATAPETAANAADQPSKEPPPSVESPESTAPPSDAGNTGEQPTSDE